MKRIIYLAAIGVIGSMGITGCNRSNESTATPSEQSAQNIPNHTSDMAEQAKGKAEAMSETVMTDDAAIRESLSSIVDDAMSKDSFPALMQFFTDTGRMQIADNGKTDYADLDSMVASIQSAWKAKYGHDFKVTSSMIKDDNSFSISSVDKAQTADGQAKDVHTATVNLTADGKAPSLAIPMQRVGKLGSWRIDVPTDLNAMTLHDNLLRALTAVKADEANWPTDQAAAYRTVTRHVLAALLSKLP